MNQTYMHELPVPTLRSDHASGNSRLAALPRIVSEVDSAPDLDTALNIIVRRTREVMAADVCTVYFTDHDQRHHVFAATDGLPDTLVGQVKAGFGHGLIGQVAESSRPVNLPRVPEDLDREFLEQSGSGRFHAFLGVPVTHRRRVQGVLLVRHRTARRFDDADEAFLSTLAAQLGSAIAIARANGELCKLCRTGPTRHLDGIAGAPGIALGKGVVLFAADLQAVPDRVPGNPGSEVERFHQALSLVRAEITRVAATTETYLSPADRALFDAYVLMLDSPELVDTVIQHIHQGNWAPGALREAIETHAQRFDRMEDEYLRERATDIRALGARILSHLQDTAVRPEDSPPDCILIGRQISAIDIGFVPPGRLRGVISAEGSPLAHAAIVARALGIPAVVGLTEFPVAALDNQEIIVDGYSGHVHLRPDPALRQEVAARIEHERELNDALSALHGLPARTTDGLDVTLYTNIGFADDMVQTAAGDSAGIGLFRSELPFMLYERFPSESEQVSLYRQALEAFAPRPVTLRTLDAGGDKPLPYLNTAEPNPALGWRGIRLTLDHPEIFLTQLRAALRADLGIGNLRLLLPMVSDMDDLEQALGLLERAEQQLLEEGFAVRHPAVGIMVEVPAAVYQLDKLAQRVDFLSVGTNDLAQYLLASDRNNPRVSGRLNHCHPALLQALEHIAQTAARAGKPVTVCGEMASEPACALLLLGLGFNALSISAMAIPRVKWAIRSSSAAQLKTLVEKALRLDRSEHIHRMIEQALRDADADRTRRQ
jgi:phosphotransferase system enzyme I (PtsP)